MEKIPNIFLSLVNEMTGRPVMSKAGIFCAGDLRMGSDHWMANYM
jgi:hypothetical protein